MASTPSGIDTGLGPVVTVQDGGPSGTPSTQGDKHRNPDFKPRITGLTPGITGSFDTDSPNHNYKPIDAAIKVKIDIPNGVVLPASGFICRIEFGTSYQNAQGQDIPPVVTATDETNPPAGPPVWRAMNVTATSFDVVPDFGVAGPATLRLRYSVNPAF